MWFFDQSQQNKPLPYAAQATVLSVFCAKPDWNRDRTGFNRHECNVTLGIVYNGKSYTRNVNVVRDKPLKVNDSVSVFIKPGNPSDFIVTDDIPHLPKTASPKKYAVMCYVLLSLSILLFVLCLVQQF